MGVEEVVPNGTSKYVDMPEEELSAMRAYFSVFRVVFPLLILFGVFVTVCSIVSAYQKPGRPRKVLRWIVAAALMSVLTQGLTFMHMFRDWEGLDTLCFVSPAIATSTYFMASLALYLFLHARASAVTYASDRLVPKLLKILLVLTMSSPLLLIVAFFVIEGKVMEVPQLAPEGSTRGPFVCTYQLDFFVAVAFLVLDTALSFSYLLIFILPVLEMVKKSRELMGNDDTNRSRMDHLVRLNLRASLIAVCSTFVVMVLLAVGYARLRYPETGPKLLYWTYTYPLVSIDVAVNLLAIMCITNVWMPRRLQRVLRLTTSLTAGSSTKSFSKSTGRTGTRRHTEINSKWTSSVHEIEKSSFTGADFDDPDFV